MHVLKNTPLEGMYHRGEFTPMDRETYTRRVELFLQHLSPKFAMHRLAAYSSRWDELVAPAWTKDKMGTHQYIIDQLRARKSFQSQFFSTEIETERAAQDFLRKKSVPMSTTHA
jgi:radical SAM superfamily enzyme